MSAHDTVAYIMRATPYACVKNKLIREHGATHADGAACRLQAHDSKWVTQVRAEQRPNGSWGRFHSQDSRLRRKYATTEAAAKRLAWLGMSRGDATVDQACAYMESLLGDLTLWPDAWEKNRWFRPAVPLFICSKLALFGSVHGAYRCVCDAWLAAVEQVFAPAAYDAERVNAITKQLIGVDVHGSYIGFHGLNNILLLASLAARMDAQVQRHYVRWLYALPSPIAYTNVTLCKGIRPERRPGELYDYLCVMKLLKRFQGFYDVFGRELDWLSRQCGSDGLFDFGRELEGAKISDDWRVAMNRRIDHTVFVLDLGV